MGAVRPGVARGQEKGPVEGQSGKGAFYSPDGGAGPCLQGSRAGNARASQGQFLGNRKGRWLARVGRPRSTPADRSRRNGLATALAGPP